MLCTESLSGLDHERAEQGGLDASSPFYRRQRAHIKKLLHKWRAFSRLLGFARGGRQAKIRLWTCVDSRY